MKAGDRVWYVVPAETMGAVFYPEWKVLATVISVTLKRVCIRVDGPMNTKPRNVKHGSVRRVPA